jgi:glycosyltransferase involved in cell wall biosynthesis
VQLRPWVTDKEAFYHDVDIFAVTSKKETFNICLIESMARKKPVISTACGGPNEIIDDQVDGLLTEINDVPSLVEKLTHLVQDEQLRSRLAEAGYLKVQQRYQRSVVQAKISEQVKQLAAKHQN